MPKRMVFVALGLSLAFATHAVANVAPGQPAPSFTKNELFTNVPHTLSEYAGKVLFIFELGWF